MYREIHYDICPPQQLYLEVYRKTFCYKILKIYSNFSALVNILSTATSFSIDMISVNFEDLFSYTSVIKTCCITLRNTR